MNGVEASRFNSITCDWAGGGIVANASDWATFIRALVVGDLVSPESRAWLTKQRNTFRYGIRYGAGTMEIQMRKMAPFMGKLPIPVGHIGILATHAYHVPQVGADIVMNFGSTKQMVASFTPLAHILQQLRRLR